jgi:ATP-dependent DNA helicase PIF1
MIKSLLKALFGTQNARAQRQCVVTSPAQSNNHVSQSPIRPLSTKSKPPSASPDRNSTSEQSVHLTSAQEAAVRAASALNPAVFITGRAGTGKSTIIQHLRMLEGVVVCAPTGIAALNCRGATLHSTFKIPPKFLDSRYPNPKTIPGANRIRILVIDEVSMVRADVMDFVSATLQYNRNSSAPFGGVKVIFVGDCRQLPPVVTESEREAIAARYTSAWWFEADCLKALELTVVQLTQIHRQRDPSLIELLDTVRHGAINLPMLARLNARCYRGPAAPDGALLLTARRKDAENVNQTKLGAIAGASKIYNATATGAFSDEKEFNVPSPRRLELKVGARVLVTKNHGTVVNGTLGTVTQLHESSVQIRADGAPQDLTLTEASWEQYRYTLRSGQFVSEVIGTYKQIPLTHGWAVTIHKAQGLTLESVCVDLGSGAFASGQTYVALSRTRSMEGLSTRRPFNQTDFIADPHVSDFHARYEVF